MILNDLVVNELKFANNNISGNLIGSATYANVAKIANSTNTAASAIIADYAKYTKTAGTVPVGTHNFSSHSDIGTYFTASNNLYSAKYAVSAKSALTSNFATTIDANNKINNALTASTGNNFSGLNSVTSYLVNAPHIVDVPSTNNNYPVNVQCARNLFSDILKIYQNYVKENEGVLRSNTTNVDKVFENVSAVSSTFSNVTTNMDERAQMYTATSFNVDPLYATQFLFSTAAQTGTINISRLHTNKCYTFYNVNSTAQKRIQIKNDLTSSFSFFSPDNVTNITSGNTVGINIGSKISAGAPAYFRTLNLMRQINSANGANVLMANYIYYQSTWLT